MVVFYGYIFQVMSFDPIDCDDFFDQNLQLKHTEPLSYNFDKIGYGSLYSIRNFGSLGFVFLVAPAIITVANLVGLCNFESCKKLRAYVNKALFWNGILGFLCENFMLMCISWMLNVTHFEWDGLGDSINSLFTLLLILLSGGFLVYVCAFYRMNATKIQNREEHVDFNERNNFLFMDFDVQQLNSKVMGLPIATLLRQLTLCAIVVFWQQQQAMSLIGVNEQTLALMILSGQLSPYEDRLAQGMDLFDDFFLLIQICHMLCFTAYVDDPRTRRLVGNSLIVFCTANVALNLGVTLWVELRQVWTDMRRWYYQKMASTSICG